MRSACSELLAKISSLSFMEIALFLSLLIFIWILWRVQRSPKSIDFVDLMIGPDGKASWSKLSGMGGFMIGSWIVIYMTLNDRMSEGLFLAYFAVCIGSPVAFGIINSRSPYPRQVNQDVRVSAPPDAQVNVTTGAPSPQNPEGSSSP